MQLQVRGGKILDRDGDEIVPDESGICHIGKRRFVYTKLYAYVSENTFELDVPKKKSRRSKRKVSEKRVMKKAPLPKPKRIKTNAHRRVALIARRTDGSGVQEFESQTQAAIELGVQRSNISLVLTGKRSHTNGYTFERKNDKS